MYGKYKKLRGHPLKDKSREKTEYEEVTKKLVRLYNDLNNGSLNHNELKITISLCGKTADIQFGKGVKSTLDSCFAML